MSIAILVKGTDITASDTSRTLGVVSLSSFLAGLTSAHRSATSALILSQKNLAMILSVIHFLPKWPDHGIW